MQQELRTQFFSNSALINVMAKAAFKASKGLLRDFGEIEHLQVSRKGVGNFVTIADKKSENILIDELSKARPDFNFITEETGLIDQGQGSDFTWIIDPLDGTSNFIHGNPHFCIVIALKRQNEVIAGVIYDPVRDELFSAEKGYGAFLNKRRLRVGSRSKTDEAIVGAGYAQIDGPAHEKINHHFQVINRLGSSLRCTGSAALDMAYVASGRLDLCCFWHLNIWDIAAGSIIITEAGGYVEDINQSEETFLETGSLLAGSPTLFPLFKEALKN